MAGFSLFNLIDNSCKSHELCQTKSGKVKQQKWGGQEKVKNAPLTSIYLKTFFLNQN